jgi:hypothetical protein
MKQLLLTILYFWFCIGFSFFVISNFLVLGGIGDQWINFGLSSLVLALIFANIWTGIKDKF